MTMGDRIKTRQQLLDEQIDAAHARAIPGYDRRDESARPRQAQDNTVANPRYVRPPGENEADGSPGVSVAAEPCPGGRG